ncbi:hypothetical protein FRC03_002920 [Tulasnella sp. 419]|nr:hypothetical protein FRC03_002920 [Tulasnella sp. 419]
MSSNTLQHRKHCLVATEGPFVGNYHPVRMTATNRRYLAFTLHFGSKNTFTPSHVCLPSHLPRLHKIFVLQGHGPASSFLFHQLRQTSAQRVLVGSLIRAACGRLLSQRCRRNHAKNDQPNGNVGWNSARSKFRITARCTLFGGDHGRLS